MASRPKPRKSQSCAFDNSATPKRSQRPQSKANKEVITTAVIMSFLLTSPDCTVRRGPTLWSLSMPLLKSPRSLAKFDKICSSKVVRPAKSAAKRLKVGVFAATKLPKATLDKASGRVLNRAALIHDFKFDMRWPSRVFGILVEVGIAFLQESIFAFLRLFGEVIQQGGIACKLLNSNLSVQFGIHP